ncbi:hypothetical protein KC316_g11709 [Hortaea werneckii]|nr:hypothetical protein KC324_g12495 [Hortaea werneckii]KAI7573772.1 hypothetical protein KC316_g11709 [Hortaea werneckii]
MGPLRSSIKLHLWLIDLFLALYMATDLTLEMKYLDITCAQARALALFFSVAIAVLGASFSAHVLITGGVYAEEQPDEPPPSRKAGLVDRNPTRPLPFNQTSHVAISISMGQKDSAVLQDAPVCTQSQIKSPPESNTTFKDYYGDLSNSRGVLQPSSQNPTRTRGSL